MAVRKTLLGLLMMAGVGEPAWADDFDRLEGRALAGVPKAEGTVSHPALSVAEIGALPRVLKGVRSGVLVVRTGDGNLARVVVSPALRKRTEAGGDPVPILVLERFATFEAGPARTRLAQGRDVLLFDGFLYDLDTGQVVPEGLGADLRYSAKNGGQLEALGGAVVYTMTRSPLIADAEPGQPSPGVAIVPGDFAGRYHLIGDGQWSGRLDLQVGDGGAVSGQFRSDQTGQSYPVTGQVQADRANHVTFAIQFPRARQDYDARLWGGRKAALAGTVVLLDGTFGFVAVREGASLEPEG